MTVLAFGNRLSTTAWAREVAKIDLDPLSFGSSGQANDIEPLEIDLSDTRSADFLILGRLLMLLDVLATKGAKIVIRMPSKDLLETEQIYLDRYDESDAATREAALRQISRHQRQRINCRLFIRQSGFDSALETGPLKRRRIDVIEENDSTSRQGQTPLPGIEPDQYDIPRPPQRQRGIIPYRWVNAAKFSDDPRITDPLLRSIRGLGLAADDATALTRGVLDELIENAWHHGQSRDETHVWTLVGGELTHPQSYYRRIDDFDPNLRDFAIWASMEPSPLLRLFIGDTGRGIPASLEAKRVGMTGRTLNEYARVPSALIDGKAILTALEYHAGYNNSDREPQGLWKVKRVVRSFQGALLITSGLATAGYIFDAAPEEHELNIASPTWLPGTMVECTVLTAPGRDIHLYKEELSSPVTSLTSAASNLSCTTALLKPSVGFDTDDLATIQCQLDRLQNVTDGGLVIGVEMPSGGGSPAGSEIEDAINSVLEIASKAANPTTITLVFSGVGRKLLSVAIDALNRRQDEHVFRPPRLHSPILVLCPENVHYWAGGTPLIRQLLSILSQSAQNNFKVLDLGQSLGIEAPSALEREIRDQPRLLHLDKGTLSLKLRPRDAVASLTQYLSNKLGSAVTAGRAPGISSGRFLTTSLRITSRWVDMQILLQHLRCYQMAGFALAEEVKSKTGPPPRTSLPTVVWTGSMDEQFASVFSLALSGVSQTFENVSALRMNKELAMGASDHPITICTDFVSRGAFVRRTIRELQDMGFSRITVAAIIDGRELAFANESRDFLRVRGSRIPIISLASVSLDNDLDESSHDPLLPIDPVTGTPLKARYPHSKTVGRQDLYVEAIRQSGAARLGHISRPGERHYTAYINPSLLFDYLPWSESALKRIVDSIKEDNAKVAPPDKSAIVGVIFPTEPKNEFSRVVDALIDQIQKSGLTCLDPIPIPRRSDRGNWTFPRFVQIPPDASHIIVIDAVCKSGKTLRELIRLASLPSTAFITCFGLIHGMNDLAAMSLQQIHRVATYSLDDPASRNQGSIPVRVRHLVRTAVSESDAGQCSVCALRHTYLSLPQTLPRSMDEHRNRLGDLLATRSRENVFAELATDLFGVHITQEDCVAYLRWRSSLEEATFSTASRALLVEHLSRLATDISKDTLDDTKIRERDALIRLLAAEHSLLEQAPMWLTSVRAKVCEVARSVLAIPVALTNDPMLRVQALTVLAHADARLFCSEYAQIVRMCRDHKTVVAHSLLEALVLLEQDWKQAEWRATLAEQISMLSHELQTENAAQLTWDFQPIEELVYLSGVANRERRLPSNSPQQAWSELKTFCNSVKRHRYDQAMWRLQRRLENLEKGMVPASPASSYSDWEYCSIALDEKVLSNLSLVRGALTSDENIDRNLLSRDDRRSWRELIDGAGRERLNEISVDVGHVFLGAEPMSIPREELEDLRVTLERWSSFFFYSSKRSDTADRSSLLTRIVDNCPTSLIRSVEDTFDGSLWELEVKGIPDDNPVLVFCSSSVLANALSHIQINAEVTHRQEGETPRFLVQVYARDETVEISVINSGSNRETKGGGRGLEGVAQCLANFGAFLKPIESLSAKWTYGVKIVLELWKWNLWLLRSLSLTIPRRQQRSSRIRSIWIFRT